MKKGRGVLSIGNSAPPLGARCAEGMRYLFQSENNKTKKIHKQKNSRTQQAPRRTAAFHQYTTRFLYTRLIYQRNDFKKKFFFPKTKTAFFFFLQQANPRTGSFHKPSETERFPLKQIDFPEYRSIRFSDMSLLQKIRPKHNHIPRPEARQRAGNVS